MVQSKFNRLKRKYAPSDDSFLTSSEEAKICLNCPYPKCNSDRGCDYYKAEMKKIKELNKNEISLRII